MQSIELARQAILNGALQKITELINLTNLLMKVPLKTVAEIGTCNGGTLYLWCQIAAPDATIVSIDLPGGPFGGGYTEEDIPRLMSYKKNGQQLYLIRENSQTESVKKELLLKTNGERLDFLMIDGDHTYEGVKKDFALYAPLVRSGGIIALHDILHHPGRPEVQVDRFWNEIKPGYETMEFCDMLLPAWRDWGGIGVIKV